MTVIETIFNKIYHPKTENPDERSFFVSLNGRVVLPRSKKSRFFVFEGLDGSGQSTQAGLVRDELERRGFDVLLTKEPTIVTEAGRQAARALKKEVNLEPGALQRLFAEDRRGHLEKVIVPALTEGRIVLCDRYFFSSFAYGALDCRLRWLIEINGDFLMPDGTFILVVPPEVCVERIKNKGEPIQIFEEEKKLMKALQNYKKLSRMFNNVFLINGEQSIENVYYSIILKILDF